MLRQAILIKEVSMPKGLTSRAVSQRTGFQAVWWVSPSAFDTTGVRLWEGQHAKPGSQSLRIGVQRAQKFHSIQGVVRQAVFHAFLQGSLGEQRRFQGVYLSLLGI